MSDAEVKKFISSCSMPAFISGIGIVVPILFFVGFGLGVARRAKLVSLENELMERKEEGHHIQYMLNDLQDAKPKLLLAIQIPVVVIAIFVVLIIVVLLSGDS